MSNEVDKRIVEMQFKNEDFEKNAAKTLQTLQELKQKLNNNFSTKGPEQLNQALKAVDVSPITKGLDTVQVKLSALQIAGKRIIENITDTAMNAIHKVTNLLQAPINQIKQGGANRAHNIEQAKFMLSGLGIEWKDIVDDINYGVQDTAYGLDAAAKVASQLVASNVSLGKDMQASLRGVSGVAAMTNSTYEEIGHIFTSVAGQGKLMTMQLQQFSLRGLNVAADLAKSMGTTEAAIRDMVTKGQIDFMTFAKAMDELYGGHAKEANKTFTGALSNTKAALSRLGADIQSQKFESFRIILLEVTTQLKELKKALKPAEDAIISMMDAVGKLVTSFIKSIDIKGIVDRISPAIKKVADYIRDFANAWIELREEATPVSNIAEYVQKLKGGMTDTKEATDDALTSLEKLVRASDTDLKRYSENAWAIWNEGKFGNGQDRIDALKEDYELTQEYVNKMIELGWDQAQMDEYLAEQKKKIEEQQKKQETVNRLKTTVSKVLTIFSNIKRVLSNITSSITNVLGAMFNGLGDAFSGKGQGFLDGMINITGAVANFSDKVAITKKRAETIRPIAKVIGDILITIAKGIYNCAKYLVQFLKAASENKIVRGIFEAIGKAIMSVVDAVKNLYTKLKESGAWDSFVEILKTIASWIGERLIDGFNLLGDIATKIGEGAAGIFEKVVEKVRNLSDESERGHGWLSKIKDFFKEDVLSGSWLTKLKDVLTDIFGTGANVFQTAYQKASDFIQGLAKGIKNLDKNDFDTILSTLTKIALVVSTVKWLWSMAAMNNNISGMVNSFDRMFEAIGLAVTKYGKLATAQRFESFTKSIATIVGCFVVLVGLYAYLESVGKDAHGLYVKVGNILGIIIGLVGLIYFGLTVLERNIIRTGKNVSILGNVRIPALVTTIIALAYMIKTLVGAMLILYNVIKSPGYDSWTMTGIQLNLAAFLAIIMVVSYFATKVDKTLVGFSGLAFVLISMGILINSIVGAFKKVLKAIDGIDKDTVSKATSTINWLVWPILIFGAGIVAITRALPTKSAIQTNPFKGIMGMFIGLAALLRLGFLPLLDTLAELRKEGDAGIAAIQDFKNITKWLLIFVGSLAVVLSVLDRDFIKNPRNIGSAATGADKLTGGFSTSSKSGLFWGLTAIIAALAAMFAALSYVMKNMQGVDSHSISRLKEMVTTILVITGILALIAGVAGTVSGQSVTIALLALAAVIASVASVMLAAGYGFKAFETALRDLIEHLPDMLNKILEFFSVVRDNKKAIVNGIKETVLVYFEAITAGVVAWAQGLSLAVPAMVSALFDCVIAILNGVADNFFNKGEDLVNAADRFAIAVLYFLGLALDKIQSRGREMFKNSVGKMMVTGIEGLFPGLDIDASEEIKEYESQAKRAEDEYNKIVGKKATSQTGNLIGGIFDEINKDVNNMGPQMFYGNKSSNIDANTLLKSFGVNTDTLPTEISGLFGGAISNGINKMSNGTYFNMDELSKQFNVEDLMSQYSNTDWYGEMWADMQTKAIEGGEDLTDIYEGYTADTWNILNMNTDDYTQVGERQFNNVGEGIRSKEEFIQAASKSVSDKALEEMYSKTPKFLDIGNLYGSGIAIGMTDGNVAHKIQQATNTLGEWAINGTAKKLDERSPSRKAKKLGMYFSEGFANGIIDSVTLATGSAEEVGEATILSMRNTIKRLTEDTMYGLDTNPRITPVLDLSNVTEGIGTMNGMLDTSHAVGLGITTSTEARAATSRRVNAIYQNGSNYDDTNAIGAIASLQGEVSTLKDAINGMQVVIDSKALVGQIATPMDKALGKMAIAGRRGI